MVSALSRFATVLALACTVLATQAQAQNVFPPNGNVGIGTATPGVLLDVYKALTSSDTVMRIQFANNTASIAGTGLTITTTPAGKGTQIGIAATTQTAVSSSNNGIATGDIAISTSFSASGDYEGVRGVSTSSELLNFDAARTSVALGGRFFGGGGTTPLAIGNAGTYLVGGVYGELTGSLSVSANPSSAQIVAGVIGMDKSTGYAQSLAGYFSGNVSIERDNNPYLSLGRRNVGNIQFGVASCAGCYNAFAQDGDGVIRVLGQGKDLILSTATTVNTGRQIVIASESSRLAVFSDSGDICLGTGC